jgi:hypothetical protein
VQHARHECPGAVNGIYDPGQPIAGIKAILLAEYAMFWIDEFNDFAYGSLSGLICQGHRIKATVVELVGNLNAGSKVGQYHPTRSAHSRARELQIFIALIIGYCNWWGVTKFR